MHVADNLIFPVADQRSHSQITEQWACLLRQNSRAGAQPAPAKEPLKRSLH